MVAGAADVVELRIPCQPEYVGVARLAILGVASRMRFSYDDVEDIRLAVGEACTTSVDWAKRNGRTDSEISIRSAIEGDTLTIEVEDHAGPRREEHDAGMESNGRDIDSQGLGALLITLLVDEVRVIPSEDGTVVSMTKRAG